MNRPNTHSSPPLQTLLAVLTGGTLLVPIAARADLSFETETARVLAPGKFEISMAAEYQHSRDGGEFALPFAFDGTVAFPTSPASPGPEGGVAASSGTAIAEVGGVELIGTVGVRHHLAPSVDVFGSISYDNMDAKLFHTGFTWKF